MKRKELAKKLSLIMLGGMLTLPCITPAVCMADNGPKAAQATEAKEEDPSAGIPETEEDDQSATLKLSMQTYEKQYKTEEGSVYKEVSFEYPVAEGNSKAAQTLNKFYKNLLTKWKKTATEDLKEAEEMAKQTESADNYYSDQVTCKITSQDDTYISVLQTGYDYTMGAHGMPYRYSYIFDAQTGKKVSAAKILGLSKKQLNDKVRKLYLKKFDQTVKEENDLFYQDRKEVETTLNRMDFNDNLYYLKNNKIRFYADPYAVGPYASGFIEVAVKL